MYHMIIIPLTTVVIAQGIKLIIDASKNKFSWGDLNSYGGMPSAHTALMVSLTTAVGAFEGLSSAAFAIALVLTILIVRDAAGLRMHVSDHAKYLNMLIAIQSGKEQKRYNYLTERLGHTPLEILGGVIVGLLIPAIYLFFI